MKTLTEKQKTDLETLIDNTSLASVLDALNNICYEKADHINSLYSDQIESKLWKKAGNVCEKTSNNLSVKMVSNY